MADVPSSAKVVVIGAGIVGNSLVWHLARLGWRDIVQIDKGPLPNPGGSTGHASNFIFLVDHSREMADLTLDSVAQYQEMGVFTQSGGIEVARTEERMEELRRRMSSSKAWGVVDSRLVTPDEIQELVPFLEKDVVVGGFYTPGVGVVDSLRAGTIMRERALELDALTVVANAEVEGLDVEAGAIKRVRTTKGDIEAEYVVIACGVWSPKVAAMAGAHIPLTPAVHQMISVGPCRSCRARRARSAIRSSATWTPSATSASTAPTWRSAPMPTGPSSWTPRTSPASSSPSCRRPGSPSPRRTSTHSWSRPSS
ncbi:MAG: FAD-binding oxidoreductase [Nocardioidaceae bacterium]